MKYAIFALSSFAISFFLGWFFLRGFIPYDEGWIVNLSYRFLQGQIPYKDFELVYTPGVIYITALGYHIFGASFFAERMVAFINSLISFGLIILIFRKLRLTFFAILIALGLFISWGPTHINFVWPVMFNITLTLALIYSLISWNKDKKTYWIFLAGLFAGINLLFKQNFGFAGGVLSLVFLISNKEARNLKLIGSYILGFLIPVAGQLFYFVQTNSLTSFVQDFNFIFIQKIYHEGATVSPLPWDYPSSALVKILKVFFYGLPFIVSAISIYYANKFNRKLFILPFFTLLFFLVSFRPTTDIVHLAPLIAISGIPLAFIFDFTKNDNVKALSLTSGFLIAILGIYTAFFTNYYKWEPKIVKDNIYLSESRGGIYVDPKAYKLITGVNSYVSKNSKKGDYIYAYLFSPAFYFLTDRNSPTKYDYSSPGLFTPQIENDTISSLKNHNVKIVITDVPMNEDSTKVGAYIKKDYKNVENIDKFGIWQRIY